MFCAIRELRNRLYLVLAFALLGALPTSAHATIIEYNGNGANSFFAIVYDLPGVTEHTVNFVEAPGSSSRFVIDLDSLTWTFDLVGVATNAHPLFPVTGAELHANGSLTPPSASGAFRVDPSSGWFEIRDTQMSGTFRYTGMNYPEFVIHGYGIPVISSTLGFNFYGLVFNGDVDTDTHEFHGGPGEFTHHPEPASALLLLAGLPLLRRYRANA